MNFALNNKGQNVAAFLLFIFSISGLLFFAILGVPLNYSMMIVMGCAVFIIAFFNTDTALIILVMSMMFSPGIKAGGITGRAVLIRMDDVLLIAIFLGWIAKMAVNKELGLFRNTPFNLPISVYLVICSISSGIGIIQGYIKFNNFFFFFLKYLEYYLIFIMVVNNLRTMRQAKRYIFFILLTCLFVCIYAWAQIPLGQRISAPFEAEGGEPNTFAAYLIFMMAILLSRMIHADNSQQRLVFLGFLGLAIMPFIMTLSRGGWISFFPMILVIVFFSKKYRFQLFALFFIFLLILPVIMPKVVHQRIEESFLPEKTLQLFGKRMAISESAVARIDAMKFGIDMISRKPVFGFGVPVQMVVDNQYARVLAETGLFGFAAYYWLLTLVFIVAMHAYRHPFGNNFSQGISLGLMAGLVGLLTHSFSAATFILIRVMEPFWFLVGVVTALPNILEQEKKEYVTDDVT